MDEHYLVVQGFSGECGYVEAGRELRVVAEGGQDFLVTVPGNFLVCTLPNEKLTQFCQLL